MAGSFSTIQVGSADGVLTVTLNRPDCLNAFNADMSVELGAALRMAHRDEAVRCVVLTGGGRAFCSGQDLREIHTAGQDAAGAHSIAARSAPGADPRAPVVPDLGAYLREKLNPLVLRLRTMEKPVVAAVNGVAAGAGVSLALAADLLLCARSASFKLAFVHVGLIPDAAATLTLVQHVGYAKAAELCFLGEELRAEDALRVGLVNRVVDDAELPRATHEIAARLAALPTAAIGLTKRALSRAWTATLDEQLEYEALLQTTAGRSADHREGVAAFLEKRPPRFAGR